MPPIEIGTAAGIAKFAPVIFLSISPKGIQVNWAQLSHTLLVSAIVAGVTMFGTMKVLEARMEYQDRMIMKLTAIAEEAVKVQHEIVPMRNLQVKMLQEGVQDHEVRIKFLERGATKR